MPNCFQLTPKGKEEPSVLAVVDTELWVKFEGAEPENNNSWYKGWYDCLGLAIACGQNWDWCRKHYKELIDIIDYLEANYSTNAWHESKV